MTTTVKAFRSTDGGATKITGEAGKLITVLTAILVDGYGGGTPTSITRSGSTATLTYNSHGMSNGDVMLVAGADQTEYNGEVVISNVTTNTFDYTVTGTPATPATGTITFKKAPCGWTKPLTGTNKAAFRLGAGSQQYLRIDDSPAQYPRLVGYSAMTDVDTGTNPFPTTAQFSGGLYTAKSNAASSATREWMALGNDRCLYLFTDCSAMGTTYETQLFFGDIVSYVDSDAYGCLLVGSQTASVTNAFLCDLITGIQTAITAHYMPAAYNQLAASIAVGKHTDHVKTGGASSVGRAGTNTISYPNPVDGGLILAPVWVHESTNKIVRGHMPGFWASCHSGRPLGHTDQFEGSGTLAGRKFISLNCYRSGSGNDAQAIIETSSTWYS